MGYYAYLEIDNMEPLSVKNEFGINVGNSLASFLFIYENYMFTCKNDVIIKWFSLLEKSSTQNLRILPKIIYAYNGEYTDQEINEFLINLQKIQTITKEELIARLDIEKKWGNIDEIIESVKEIVRILPTLGEDTFWYVKENTYPAFKSLLNLLQKAQFEGAISVRLHFE